MHAAHIHQVHAIYEGHGSLSKPYPEVIQIIRVRTSIIVFNTFFNICFHRFISTSTHILIDIKIALLISAAQLSTIYIPFNLLPKLTRYLLYQLN